MCLANFYPCGYFQPFLFDVCTVLFILHFSVSHVLFHTITSVSRVHLICPICLSLFTYFSFFFGLFRSQCLPWRALKAAQLWQPLSLNPWRRLKESQRKRKGRKSKSGEEVNTCNHEQEKETFWKIILQQKKTYWSVLIINILPSENTFFQLETINTQTRTFSDLPLYNTPL